MVDTRHISLFWLDFSTEQVLPTQVQRAQVNVPDYRLRDESSKLLPETVRRSG